jgi:hypothetical protein
MGKCMNEVVKTIVTLLILSLAAGLILATLGIRPSELPAALGMALSDVARFTARIVDWAWRYLLLGATIVIPIWILLYLLRKLRR